MTVFLNVIEVTAYLTEDDNDDKIGRCGSEEQTEVWRKILRTESSSYCRCNDLQVLSSLLRIMKKTLTAKVPGMLQ